MSQYLPTHGFRWLTRDEIDHLSTRIHSLNDFDEDGYIFEVDLRYPTRLHDQHNDYPLAPEHLEVTSNMLSPFQQTTYPKHRLQKTKKLVPNLMDKHKYIVHYRNLKYYLEKGMELTHIHRVLTFKQSPWLKSYVDFNTERRSQSTSEFEKSFFKLMNNSVFGEFFFKVRFDSD